MTLKRPELLRQQCYINGIWQNSETGKRISVQNPFNAEEVGGIPECSEKEVDAAIEAAYNSWPAWRARLASERAALLTAWSALIDANLDDLATILTLEQGKPLTEARTEIQYGNQYIKWFAAEALRVYGDVVPAHRPDTQLIVLREPVGVCGLITPWNFPNAMIARKAAPALAAGCPILIKPAKETPFSALAMAVLAEEAGFPPGTFNVITGDSAMIGERLTRNPLCRKISFTGSTSVGKLLMEKCSHQVKKVSLELGGNAPFIVFEDANIDQAVAGLMTAKFRNSGQTCVSANRIYLHESVHDAVIEKLKVKMQQLVLGNGLNETTTQGPLINQAALDKVQQLIASALSQGAKCVLGGKPAQDVGALFFQPTLLTEVSEDMTLSCDEIFGPVLAIRRFRDEQEVIAAANATQYGLAAYFYTQSLARCWRVSQAIESGMVGINTGAVSSPTAPFGGVKESGLGREGSQYGIDEYTEMKYLCMSYS